MNPGPDRRTAQRLLPTQQPPAPGHYDLYPAHNLGPGTLGLGFAALAERFTEHRVVVIDGFAGVFWDVLRVGLEAALGARGLRVAWLDAAATMLEPERLERVVAPSLGGDDPLFGTRFRGSLAALFNSDRLGAFAPDPEADLSVVYGPGAALSGWDGLLVYVDLPKNEVQYRARAERPTNLGVRAALDPKAAYKRSYFVDWPALSAHKAALLPRLEVFVNGQRPAEPTFVSGDDLRTALDALSRSSFRPRP